MELALGRPALVSLDPEILLAHRPEKWTQFSLTRPYGSAFNDAHFKGW